MKQISVAIDMLTENKLKKRAESKGLSLAQYVRSLVDLGLKLEEISEQNNDKNNVTELWKNSLLWTLETRYLARYLVEQLDKNDKTHVVMMKAARDQAQAYIDGLFKETI